MSFSRRDLALLLPALAAAQQPETKKPTERPILGPKIYPFDDLPVRTSANGAMKSRALFDGVTTRGQRLTAHISELAPGHAPHPAERQKHEEIFMLRQGTLQVTMGEEVSTIGPGSVIFVPYEQLFGLKNVGTEVAQYYVVSIEDHKA